MFERERGRDYEKEREKEREKRQSEREREKEKRVCVQSCMAVRTRGVPSDCSVVLFVCCRLTADLRPNLHMAYRCRRQAFKMRKRRFECGHPRS